MAVEADSDIKPYTIDIPDETLVDLKRRLAATRWPDAIEGIGWEQGTSVAFLKELVAYWRDEFDWRAHERRLNELPHYLTAVDGLDIHFIHARGDGPRPYPLIITHGWPSTFFEITKLIPLLTDPAAHGGDSADAFDVVVPSVPGFGFSERPRHAGVPPRIPELWVELMGLLGYERFGAQGGDIGGGITARLGMYHPERVEAIHVTNVYGSHKDGDRPLTEAERRHLDAEEQWDIDEGAYQHQQMTRPQTLAHGLNDSPAGLAAWIVEKFRNWSDCDGDVESVFSKDELLINLTIYWATETIASSFHPYYESAHNPKPRPWQQIEVPCAVAVFPKDLSVPPREWAERTYNVQQWTEMPRGGHFAAFEQPELLAEDIRRFFRTVR